MPYLPHYTKKKKKKAKICQENKKTNWSCNLCAVTDPFTHIHTYTKKKEMKKPFKSSKT